ncbi:MAG: class I SAM-dependent methyltransferase [Hoeflea sp.]|uniref:class I SAM-dependent methyltransferase n=1 Tax=Hoeflea sp. TaxID=1940281 RepID=UPI001DAF92AD|nr:class I SAM-dependent methyltransferase [Hoeflea sp.]MBU4527227.1 class I SAM-dependent methyltransferase [Alphaproteobacteria bacterium]MBU4546990.1 class I SAM-dependent methyltransferase [Alphaproteobacteria bacterium]MBU4551498.1 class I SAM-dependent methyltransferase [Alphaproteobacteria bacterium]MBV1725503.1 class I SAM-dependent methyltransferase [Hoeflea sp.]MBV1759551.1 class I SAM-dependent methyltransferase [Hoeflea sp.]
MTPLAHKIVRLIEQTGPLRISDYFALCLADPEYGYYQSREPFGRSGDFITAPEVSQLFGEMIGVSLVHAWQAQGAPSDVRIVEIGPGRGTLMSDALRVIARLAPDLYAGASIHMVETSERLRNVQRQTLVRAKERISWHKSFEEVPDGFTLMVANELFDAVPIRQFVKTREGFRERVVGLDSAGSLAFGLGPGDFDPSLLPVDEARVPEGEIFELSPARSAVMQTVAAKIVRDGGTALAIDYGHLITGFGDTLQAVYRHEYDPPLARPGEADITSHVDFQALAEAALAAGAHVHRPMTQGEFLVGLGIVERAGALGSGRDSLTQAAIRDAVNRLAGEGEGRMGALFKVLAVSGDPVRISPFEHVAA